MLIAGISLQLIAGIIFGLSHIVPTSGFKNADKLLKRLLLSPLSRLRYQIGIPLIGAIITPIAFITVNVANFDTPNGSQWFQSWVGILISSLVAATFYLFALNRFVRLLSRGQDFKELSDDIRFRILLYSNIILILIFGVLFPLGYFVTPLIQSIDVSVAMVIRLLLLVLGLVLIILALLSLFAGLTSLVFILLALIMKLIAIMARTKETLWIIVLSLYAIGGAILIVNAYQS